MEKASMVAPMLRQVEREAAVSNLARLGGTDEGNAPTTRNPTPPARRQRPTGAFIPAF
jgi:hypothetical protein